MMHAKSAWTAAAILAGTMVLGVYSASAQEKEVLFGEQCDRTGPTQNVGIFMCPGFQDYISLVNSKGGVEGYKIKVLEIDNEYKGPPPRGAPGVSKKSGGR